MWRGLMLNRAVQHFLEDVRWGDLDYLLIDMPPGTGDVQMGLARMLPRTEILIVTTPGRSAQKVAVRAADMARKSYLRVAGVIENMSAFVCDHGESYPLFGEGGGEDLAHEAGVPLLGSIPLEPARRPRRRRGPTRSPWATARRPRPSGPSPPASSRRPCPRSRWRAAAPGCSRRPSPPSTRRTPPSRAAHDEHRGGAGRARSGGGTSAATSPTSSWRPSPQRLRDGASRTRRSSREADLTGLAADVNIRGIERVTLLEAADRGRARRSTRPVGSG